MKHIKKWLARPFSASQYTQFTKYGKETWLRKYILNDYSDPLSKEIIFGSYVDKRLQEDPTYLPQVIRYKNLQNKMTCKLSDFSLLGISDAYEYPHMRDYKTGKAEWNQKTADESIQLTMYALMIHLAEGIKPEDLTLYIDWLPTMEDEKGEIKLVDENDVKTFVTKRTKDQCYLFAAEIIRVRQKMLEYALIHKDTKTEECYTNYVSQLINKNNNNMKIPTTKTEQLEEGNYPAIVNKIVYMGTVEGEYKGEKTSAYKVNISFEIPTETKVWKEGEDAKPTIISKMYSLSMNKKSALRPIVEGIVGGMNDAEIADFDLDNILGKSCLLNVTYGISETGKEKQNLTTSKLIKGMEEPVAVNPQSILSYQSWNEELFQSLPEWMRNEMSATQEYKSMKGGDALSF